MISAVIIHCNYSECSIRDIYLAMCVCMCVSVLCALHVYVYACVICVYAKYMSVPKLSVVMVTGRGDYW